MGVAKTWCILLSVEEESLQCLDCILVLSNLLDLTCTRIFKSISFLDWMRLGLLGSKIIDFGSHLSYNLCRENGILVKSCL